MRSVTCFLFTCGLLVGHSATAQTIEAGGGLTTIFLRIRPSVSVGVQLTPRFVVDLTAAILHYEYAVSRPNAAAISRSIGSRLFDEP